MAEQQGKRQGESIATRSGEGERGLASRRYQDPFSFFDAMFDRLQRDVFGTSLLGTMFPGYAPEREGGAARVPRVQMKEADNAVVLTAELPGIDPEDIQVECREDVLTIRGETQRKEEREGGHTEQYASFYRQIRLPEDVDADQAQASYKNGMLSIRFPKRAERSHVKQIPISSESRPQPSKEKAA
jgi:HSP20 family protein